MGEPARPARRARGAGGRRCTMKKLKTAKLAFRILASGGRERAPLALALVSPTAGDAEEVSYLLAGRRPDPHWLVLTPADIGTLTAERARQLKACDAIVCYGKLTADTAPDFVAAVAVCETLNLNTVAVCLVDAALAERLATLAPARRPTPDGEDAPATTHASDSEASSSASESACGAAASVRATRAARSVIPIRGGATLHVFTNKQDLVEALADALVSQASFAVRPRLAQLELARGVLARRESRELALLLGAALACLALGGPLLVPVAAELIGGARELIDAIDTPEEARVHTPLVAAAAIFGLTGLDERGLVPRLVRSSGLPALLLYGALEVRRCGLLEQAVAFAHSERARVLAERAARAIPGLHGLRGLPRLREAGSEAGS